MPNILLNGAFCSVLHLVNSRCCCNETPTMTGWTLDFFYLHYTENQQSCLRANAVWNAYIYNKRMLCETRACLARLWQVLYAVRTWLRQVLRVYCMTQFSWKQLCWVPRWSAGKNKSRFPPVVGGISLQQHLLLVKPKIFFLPKHKP